MTTPPVAAPSADIGAPAAGSALDPAVGEVIDAPAAAGRTYERAELVPEVVRHAEQLRIDTVWVPAQTVRVHRRIITETVTVSVEVRREVVSLEHLAVGDAEAGSGGAHDAAEHLPLEIVLSHEVPVVTLQGRPYQRVRVGVEEFDGERAVREQVRVEQVEIVTAASPVPRV